MDFNCDLGHAHGADFHQMLECVYEGLTALGHQVTVAKNA
jgi:hypothetical protein